MADTRDRPDSARNPPEDGETSESRQTLWLLGASPTIWAVHFLASYITAAIWCAKTGDPAGPIGWIPMAVAIYTGVALVGIGLVTRIGWRRHDYGTAAVPHDFDTRADRHRFLGFATLLLSLLSAISVIYVAGVAIFFGSCR